MTKFRSTLFSLLLAIYTYNPITTANINDLYIEIISLPPFPNIRNNFIVLSYNFIIIALCNCNLFNFWKNQIICKVQFKDFTKRSVATCFEIWNSNP